jgi:hypothetical protein
VDSWERVVFLKGTLEKDNQPGRTDIGLEAGDIFGFPKIRMDGFLLEPKAGDFPAFGTESVELGQVEIHFPR